MSSSGSAVESDKDCPSTSAEVMVTHILVEKRIGSSESVVILDDKMEESMDCSSDVAQTNEIGSKDDISASSQPKDEKTEVSVKNNKEALEEGNTNKKPDEKKAVESAKNDDVTTEQVQSALGVFFKEWDEFTKEQKDEIERFIRNKAKAVTAKTFPKILTREERQEQWKKKKQSRIRKTAAKRELERKAKLEETEANKNTVNKETTDNSSVATTRLRSARRKRRNRPQRRHQERNWGASDQVNQSRYRQTQERRFVEPTRRSINRHGRWTVTSKQIVPYCRSPWAVSHPGPEIIREPMELLMREMGRFFKMMSSMPAPRAFGDKPASPPPSFYVPDPRFNNQYGGDANHSNNRHTLKVSPPPLSRSQQLNETKSFSPSQRRQQQSGVRSSPYTPQGYFTSDRNPRTDLRWVDQRREDPRISQISPHLKDGRRRANITTAPWN